MGCAASKTAVTPVADPSGNPRESHRSEGTSVTSLRQPAGSGDRKKKGEGDRSESGKSGKVSSSGRQSLRLGNLHRYIEGEQVAAGWPNWLSSVAREAIHGWVPLKADSFEKLDKIGQGTYSSVFRARDLDTGKIVALKKVRFDNFEPESVRFMAREIQILRRLCHPNIVNLEGLITSRLSRSIYLVFEYMEHDLAGLSSCPDIKFSESQIKCYMNQLLSGLEHCHSRGIIHRDIKGANLLVNNHGILKIADFGLANFSNPVNKQPLTSRVVTLWYRPPELLLGSTDYEATVDLWSVGCVFAEMFLAKPILQGRTEVEQLHKIFKMCGSPTDEYWKKSKLPHATIFKPHHPYESCLRETFKCLPGSAFNLLETFLSVEPDKRGTASSSLASEYFRTKPYACEPSSLPKYPPNKEIDARSREESCRKRANGRVRGSQPARRPSGTDRISRERSALSKLATHQEEPQKNTNGVNKPDGKLHLLPSADGDVRLLVDLQPVAAINSRDEGPRLIQSSHRDIPFSGPLNTAVKKLKEDLPYVVSHSRPRAVTHCSDLKCPNSFDYSDGYHYMGNTMSFKHGGLGYQVEGDKVEFSGPLLPQSHKVNEFLEKHERQVRQAVRRSWFQRVAGKRQGR